MISDFLRNAFDDAPTSLGLFEKKSLVDATVVTAPLVGLDERLGMPLVESDLRQSRHSPRSRVLPLQLDPESPTAFGKIGRHGVGCEDLAPVSLHASDVVVRDEDDGDRVAELGE